MTVKTTYSKDTGKSYTVLSESGSDIVRHFVLDALLGCAADPRPRERCFRPAAELQRYMGRDLDQQCRRGQGKDCLRHQARG